MSAGFARQGRSNNPMGPERRHTSTTNPYISDTLLHHTTATAEVAEPPKTVNQFGRDAGYTGDVCDICGSTRMRRNGSCLVCEGCGTTTGCS